MIGSVGPILMAGVKCSGYEAELYNCTSDRRISCEDRGRHAGVRCITGKYLLHMVLPIVIKNAVKPKSLSTQKFLLTESEYFLMYIAYSP